MDFIREISGKRYIDLAAAIGPPGPKDNSVVASEGQVTGPVPRELLAPARAPVALSVGPGIHINIEIHIAADASSETVEEIFRNMRRYVLTDHGQADDGNTDAE